MPYDAVALAGAQVAAEHLRQYLTPATITTPLTAYLAARFPQAQITHGLNQRSTVCALFAHRDLPRASWPLPTGCYAALSESAPVSGCRR